MRLLLDAHISPAVARALQGHGIDVVVLRDWLGGGFRSASDDQLLITAASDRCVLVSYDCQTLPPLLRDWSETGRHHAGVILVDEKTVRPNDIGGLLRALRALFAQTGDEDWRDRVVFLRSR